MASLHVGMAHALLDIDRTFERGNGDQPSLLLWANLLRVIPREGITVTDLAPAARISRRAVKSWITRQTGHGRLEVTDAGPRQKVVRLTSAGRRDQGHAGERVAVAEEEWIAGLGASLVDPLRAALEALVSKLDLELPHYPMTYGGSDHSAIGGPWVAAKPGPPRIPAHGTDWVPVVREDRDTSGLPLHALLSQALMAFTIDYEEQIPLGLATSAILTRAMPTGALRLADVPPILSVDGSGKSGLERHGIVRVTGAGDRRVAKLRKIGLWVRDSHEAVLARVVGDWRDRYGDEVVDDLTDALGSVDAALPDDLPDHVLIRHSPKAGFRDVSLH